MTESKIVSVIIPVYNAECHVGKCISSFLNQTYQQFELIVIDDGSKDDSLQVLYDWQKKAPDKVKVYSQENKGVAKTRNRGILEANGIYIMFADNDDYVEPDYIEKMVQAIEDHNADMVICSCRKVDEQGRVLYEQILSSEEWSKFRMITPWAKIIRKDFLLTNNIVFGEFQLGEDSFFSVTAYNRTDKITVTSYIGYNWVQHNTSVSNTVQKNGLASPLPFLNALIKENEPLKFISNEMFEYFILKFIIWHLYYICDTVEAKKIKEYSKAYFEWLGSKFPNYKKNKLITVHTPLGEELRVRLLVYIMVNAPQRLRIFFLRMFRALKKVKLLVK